MAFQRHEASGWGHQALPGPQPSLDSGQEPRGRGSPGGSLERDRMSPRQASGPTPLGPPFLSLRDTGLIRVGSLLLVGGGRCQGGWDWLTGQTLLGQSGRPGGRARGGRGARGRPRRTPSGPWPLGTAGPAPFQIRLLPPRLPRPPALSLVTVTATATKPPHLLASRPTNSLGGPWPSLNHTALQERCELRPQRCGRAVPGAHEEAATSRVFIVNRICLHLALPPGQSRVTGGAPGGRAVSSLRLCSPRPSADRSRH